MANSSAVSASGLPGELYITFQATDPRRTIHDSKRVYPEATLPPRVKEPNYPERTIKELP